MFYIYTNEHGDHFLTLLSGDINDIATVIEAPVGYVSEHGVKISHWEIDYAIFDNGTNDDGSPKGLKQIDFAPIGADKQKIIKVLFEKWNRAK